MGRGGPVRLRLPPCMADDKLGVGVPLDLSPRGGGKAFPLLLSVFALFAGRRALV